MRQKKTNKLISVVPAGNYDHDFIENNPIPARCTKCGFLWIDDKKEGIDSIQWTGGKNVIVRKNFIANDAIRAPSLENCHCFYCSGKLEPLDKKAYGARLHNLPYHLIDKQIPLLFAADDC